MIPNRAAPKHAPRAEQLHRTAEQFTNRHSKLVIRGSGGKGRKGLAWYRQGVDFLALKVE